MKLPKHLKGKYVSRAAFAKMQAEKQRLHNDIRTIVKGGADGLKVWTKWRKHFKFWEDINMAIKEIAKKELPELLERLNKEKNDERSVASKDQSGNKSLKQKCHLQ